MKNQQIPNHFADNIILTENLILKYAFLSDNQFLKKFEAIKRFSNQNL